MAKTVRTVWDSPPGLVLLTLFSLVCAAALWEFSGPRPDSPAVYLGLLFIPAVCWATKTAGYLARGRRWSWRVAAFRRW
ncbi:hypothetical protein [Rhodococcus sp. NPDC058514]|uniref:hypothetical protein n=1 Tax=unclassified Rhodococcus (in: high G+C Gram-positive bacteria) TaxID=192944 RepID=UPI00365D8110